MFEEKQEDYFVGHTKNYIVSKIKTNENLENRIIKILVTEAHNNEIIGEIF